VSEARSLLPLPVGSETPAQGNAAGPASTPSVRLGAGTDGASKPTHDMRELPPETLHLPFDSGSFRMAMNLTAAPASAWFELDDRYPDEMRQRRELLATRHGEVFEAHPESAEACQEALELVADNLTCHHTPWFRRDGNLLHNALSGESWDLAALPLDPLEVAGRLVQEDLCVVRLADGVPRLSAAVLCFPSRWRLQEKLGRPIAAVHGPVPFYAERLAKPVDRFMHHVRPGHVAQRLNWSLLDDPTLYQPGGHSREGLNPAITQANAGERIYLRVERQTLRSLPLSKGVLFGIRVHVYPLGRVITTGELAGRLAEAVCALPPEMQRYKSLAPFKAALLAWLDDAADRYD
jgi:dimethylamine monooxygenase subunit A